MPKVQGTINLDRVFGNSLDFFVILSSLGGIIGSKGQANYCAGCTFQDAFARHRASLSRPVRTIDLCAIDSEGYTAENQFAAAHAIRQGSQMMNLEKLLALLDHAISWPLPTEATTAQVVTGARLQDSAHVFGSSEADPRFSHTWERHSRQNVVSDKGDEGDLFSRLQEASTQQDALNIVQRAIITRISKLLDVPTTDINPRQTVSSYGIDSLVAVEFRNWILKHLEANVQSFELLSAFSIQELAQIIVERSKFVPPAMLVAKN
ncbi:hypothetical protein EYZ11_005838 [Aspergillus tanneri]|uniref:Carrier domain-containing protein n=1 Tax=Aspergillus tanneri TaxID=1220188 RepID=A0A4S3JH45_9EURO|nr:hypothetical protein EYZ11_005838 [Aspergillus tanneri]